MSLSGGKHKEPIQSVSQAKGKDSPIELEREIEQLIQKEQNLKLKSLGGEEKPNREAFEQVSKELPKQIQRTLQKLDASQVYRTFKLVGKDYVVHDRREEKESLKPKDAKDTIAEAAKKPLSELLIREGKLTPTKEKTYENFLAGFDPRVSTPEQSAATKRLQQLFARFEEVLIQRFEGGEEIVQSISPGVALFLKKTIKQWRAFFARFRERTVKRQLDLESIKELIFRDFVSRNGRHTLISDLSLTNGLFEKFARLNLSQEWQPFVEWLATLNPGQILTQETLKKYGRGNLQYLAIKEPKEEEVRAFNPSAGKFLMAAQTEEKIAKDLGFQLTSQLKEKGKLFGQFGRKGKGKLEEETFEEPKAFVPWWNFGPLKKHLGRPRWFVWAVYLTIGGALVLSLAALLLDLF